MTHRRSVPAGLRDARSAPAATMVGVSTPGVKTYAYEPPPPPRPARRRRWLAVLLVAWGLFLAGAALWAVRYDPPTVREQAPLSAALTTVDAALADVVNAASGADVVPAVLGYEEVDRDCRITAVRSGARFSRTARLYTRPGGEPGLVEQLAARLPARYKARVRHTGAAASLRADAGDYVAVRATADGTGLVRVVADTGCRPVDRPVRESEATPAAADRAPVTAVLALLAASDVQWHTHRVACPGGGVVSTVEALARGAAPPSLADALKPASPAPLLATRDVYAFRHGPVGVAARRTGADVTVSATTGC
jgi:hypothetical protein